MADVTAEVGGTMGMEPLFPALTDWQRLIGSSIRAVAQISRSVGCGRKMTFAGLPRFGCDLYAAFQIWVQRSMSSRTPVSWWISQSPRISAVAKQ
jgi:hypothetical protein